jgi:hypothetical protein
MHRLHRFPQVVGAVADGIQVSIAGFPHRIEVSCLGNRPAAQNTDLEAGLFFLHID